MHERWRSIGSGVALIFLAAAPTACSTGTTGTTGTASASCVAPYLDDRPPGGDADPAARRHDPTPTVESGGVLEVYGHWYTSTCNDTGGDDPLEPLAPVRLTLTLPDGRAVSLGQFTPHGSDMGFRADVRIPRGAHAGTATVRDDQESRGTCRITVTPRG